MASPVSRARGAVNVAAGTFAQQFMHLQVLIRNGLLRRCKKRLQLTFLGGRVASDCRPGQSGQLQELALECG